MCNYDRSFKIAEAVPRRCSVKNVFLKISQYSQENTFVWVSFLNKLNFIKKETLAHMFSREFCEIFMDTFFWRAPPVAA